MLLDYLLKEGVQWLSGRVLDSRPKGHRFEPHQHHCIVSMNKVRKGARHINPSLVQVKPTKTRPNVAERLGHKQSTKINFLRQTLGALIRLLLR